MSMLVINPIGGLGNRMRAIASGISLAIELGCDYKIVWLRNWELNARFEDVFLASTEFRNKIEYPGSLAYSLLYSCPRKQNGYISAITLRRFGLWLTDQFPDFSETTDNQEMFKRNVQQALRSGRNCYIQAGTEFYPYSDEFYRSLFCPNQEISRRVEEEVSKLGNCRYGMHIRRTDNIESILHSPINLFEDKIRDLLEAQPEAKIYLASDSEEVKDELVRKFPGVVFTSRSAQADRASVEGIKDAVVEMYTLAASKTIFGSWYSSFSEAAAKVGNTQLVQLYL